MGQRMDFDCRECGKKYGPDAFGWTGSLAVITAYGLTTYLDEDEVEAYERQIALLNLYGSSAIGYVCYKGKVWQAFVLEVAWFGIALTSFIGSY